MALVEAIVGVNPNSSEASLLEKRKGKELTIGTSNRSKKKAGETSSDFLPSTGANAELWKPKLFACKLDGK